MSFMKKFLLMNYDAENCYHISRALPNKVLVNKLLLTKKVNLPCQCDSHTIFT